MKPGILRFGILSIMLQNSHFSKSQIAAGPKKRPKFLQQVSKRGMEERWTIKMKKRSDKSEKSF